MTPAPRLHMNSRVLYCFAVLVLLFTGAIWFSASPASAEAPYEHPDWPSGYLVEESLDGPDVVEGAWQRRSSGDRGGDAWLFNDSGDGSATYNFGKHQLGNPAFACWIPQDFPAGTLNYRVQHDRVEEDVTTDASQLRGSWLVIPVGSLSSQYDLRLVAVANQNSAVADECHLMDVIATRSGGAPWHPTATKIVKDDRGVTFHWRRAEPANGVAAHSHIVSVSVPGTDETLQICSAWWEYPRFTSNPPAGTLERQSSCSASWDELETITDGLGDQLLDVSVKGWVSYYRAERFGYPDYYAPTSLTRPQVDLPRPANPRSARVSEVRTTSALVSWDHPSGSNAATYRVWLSDVGPGGPFCESSAPFDGRESCRLTGLAPGTSYTANVFAMNADGLESLRTVQVEFSTKPDDLPLPGDPRGVRVANVKKYGATVLWDHPAGSTAVAYRVWLSDVGPGGPFCESSAPFDGRESCRLTGLDANTTYTANVFAMNADGGRSVGSVQVVFTTEAEPNHCSPTGKYTRTRDKGVKKANERYDLNVAKAFDRLEDKPNKLARKIRKLAKTRDDKIAKVEATYDRRCP